MFRTVLLVILGVVVLASAIGVQRAYSVPSEVGAEKVLLAYEHQGEFDYRARIKGTYLYEDIALEDSPYVSTSTDEGPANPAARPKYPLEHVSKLDMSFSYSFIAGADQVRSASAEVEIGAVFEIPASGREEVLLIPATGAKGDFTVYFTLNPEDLALATRTMITADVYTTVTLADGTPMFESYRQVMTISSNGPLIEMTGPMSNSIEASFGRMDFEQKGDFGYVVQLKPGSPFGVASVGPPSAALPPAPPIPLSSTTPGPGDPLFYTLLEGIDFTFSYGLAGDRGVGQVQEEVEVIAILENPGVWRKEFVLVPLSEKHGGFAVNFSLDNEDFRLFRDVYRVIERETGVSGAHDLTIQANVSTAAQTEYGQVVEPYQQTLSTSLSGSVMEWKEDLAASNGGTITRVEMVPNPARIMGLSVPWIRGLAILVLVMALLGLGYVVALKVWVRPEEPPLAEKEMRWAKKKHKDAIVDVAELPSGVAREGTVQMSTLPELIKTADDLLKPVLHKAEDGRHTYCVVDGPILYQYVSEA